MIVVKHKNRIGLVYADIWFCNQNINYNEADVVNYFAVPEIWKDFRKNPVIRIQHSLLTDLKQEDEIIFNKIQARTRTKIRNAEKEGVEYKIFTNQEITPEIIKSFCKTYLAMWNAKGVNTVVPDSMFESYKNAHALAISVSYYRGQPIVWHSYVFDESNARLLHSCSDFRNEVELKKIIGFANNGLHWFDIAYFKKTGVHNYDWGGVRNPENPNGIDEFKMKFGGELVTYYNLSKEVTLKAKLYESAKRSLAFKILKRLKNK